MKTTTASGIYRINIGERFYVGSASSLSQRKSRHLRDLRNGKHSNPIMQNSFDKNGESELVFTVLMHCEKKNLLKCEQLLLDRFGSDDLCMNVCTVANSQLGLKRSDETKRRMSIAATGRKNPAMAARNRDPAFIKKANLKKKGRPFSEAHKKALKAGAKARRAAGKNMGGRPLGS